GSGVAMPHGDCGTAADPVGVHPRPDGRALRGDVRGAPLMCGICGAVSLDGPLAPGVRASVRAMAAALAHRGPDGEGFHDTEQAAIGHRRLSIIDLAGGAQPMGNEDGSCWIAFNGEIY